MVLVDDQGRVFGRFNLLDVALAVILVGLIPLGYGAYALFRVPMPRLTGIEPASIQVEPEFRVKVFGENLRPYMRVSLNDMQGRAFFFRSATEAEVVFGDIPPGTYDVVLYDYAQERARLPKAVTVTPPALPPAQVQVAGFLTSIEASQVPTMKAGFVFPGVAEIIEVGSPAPDLARVMSGDKPIEIPVERTVRIPALLNVHCSVEVGNAGFGQCRNGQVLGPSVYLMLPVFNRRVPFLITEIRPTGAASTIEVTVRMNGNEPALPLMRKGDVDLGYSQNQFAGGATIVSGPTQDTREITLRLPAYATLTGWTYGTQQVRIGAPLLLVTARYQAQGVVTALPPPPAGRSTL